MKTIALRLLFISLLFATGTGLGAGGQEGERAEAAAVEGASNEAAQEPEAEVLPPVRFVPTETISADKAISFPIDI